MSLDVERDSSGARPVTIVEVDLDWIVDAVPAVNPDNTLCYKTPATTQNADTHTISTKTRRFCSTTAPRLWELNAIPCLANMRLDTTQLKVGESLGSFGQMTLTLNDFTDDDRQEDPFWSQRTHDTRQGTYFSKLAARNPYVQGRALRILTGYAGERYQPDNFEVRHYLIRSLKRTKQATWQITAVSPLQLINLRGAQAPRPIGWRLANPLTESSTTAILVDWSLGSDDPMSGTCRINDELCVFTRSNTELTLARAQDDTVATTHDAGDTIQPALSVKNASIPSILRTLLVDHAGLDEHFIPWEQWQQEADTWLAQYQISPLPITEPTNVIDLINELCELVGMVLWYDEQERHIRLLALRPVPIASTHQLTDDDLVSEVTSTPDVAARISRVVLLYAQRSAITSSDNETNYRRKLIGQAFGEGASQYDGPSPKIIKSRWFTEQDDALAARTTFTIANSRQDGRTALSFELNKRHAHIDLGDVVAITSRDLVDTTGQPKPTYAIIVKRTPNKNGLTIAYIAEPFPYVTRSANVMADDHTATYASTPANQRDPGWFLSNPDGSLPGGDPAYTLS